MTITTNDDTGAAGASTAPADRLVHAVFGALAALNEATLGTGSTAGRVADDALGIGWWATRAPTAVVDTAWRRAAPALGAVLGAALDTALDPPLVPERLSPRVTLRRVTRGWRAERASAEDSAQSASDIVGVRAVEILREVVPARTLALVLHQMDLDALVGAVLDEVDLTEIVMTKVDLITIAHAVIDGVDLPKIVRESSGSMASETRDTIRLQGIDADRAIGRWVDRMLLRGEQPAR